MKISPDDGFRYEDDQEADEQAARMGESLFQTVDPDAPFVSLTFTVSGNEPDDVVAVLRGALKVLLEAHA